MATLNLEYYTGVDIYSDGDTEENLLQYYRGNINLSKECDAYFYLTTHIRENILNWYPFSGKEEVLEIGCGCGTLSDLLCRKCATVYSVEGSKRRASITYERNKKHQNLFVYAGEFGRFDLNKKFDYVILIGVFEYAKRFFGDKENPALFFLEEIKKVLKHDGKVLMAIENRYGLKYWSGVNEDHIPKPYIGLADYEQYDVQTFGMNELQTFFYKMGWNKIKFYYPFPDYKLPEVIYTERHLPSSEELEYLPIYLYNSNSNFDLRKTYQGLIQNNQFGFFSNSFLIECGSESCELSNITFAKELSYRKEQFRIITVQETNNKFKKIATTSKGIEHLHTIHANHQKLLSKRIPVVSTKFIDEYMLEIEYCSGENLSEHIYKCYNKGGVHKLYKELRTLWEFYKEISVKKELSSPISSKLLECYSAPTPVLSIALIDGNVANIMRCENGDYTFIDQEWVSPMELPAEYLLFYSILHICTLCQISNEEALFLFDISEEKQRIFQAITTQFYLENKVIDDFVLEKQRGLNYQWEEDEINVCPVCYYNTGNGFNEDEKCYGMYSLKSDGFYHVQFTLPKETKDIRMDPALCGEKCLYFTTVLINGKQVTFKENNIVNWEGKKILSCRNPHIILDTVEYEFLFSINLKKMTISQVEEYFHFMNGDC